MQTLSSDSRRQRWGQLLMKLLEYSSLSSLLSIRKYSAKTILSMCLLTCSQMVVLRPCQLFCPMIYINFALIAPSISLCMSPQRQVIAVMAKALSCTNEQVFSFKFSTYSISSSMIFSRITFSPLIIFSISAQILSMQSSKSNQCQLCQISVSLRQKNIQQMLMRWKWSLKQRIADFGLIRQVKSSTYLRKREGSCAVEEEAKGCKRSGRSYPCSISIDITLALPMYWQLSSLRGCSRDISFLHVFQKYSLMYAKRNSSTGKSQMQILLNCASSSTYSILKNYSITLRLLLGACPHTSTGCCRTRFKRYLSWYYSETRLAECPIRTVPYMNLTLSNLWLVLHCLISQKYSPQAYPISFPNISITAGSISLHSLAFPCLSQNPSSFQASISPQSQHPPVVQNWMYLCPSWEL